MLKKILFAAIAAGVTLAGVTAADASGGCGYYFHRGPYGGCRPNGPAVVVVVPAVGVYYPGHGYWYGGRYWWHRYRWGGGWRYR
jgi:hypothetical protein